jgi:3-hydroxyacyl-CoA dehydrogenase
MTVRIGNAAVLGAGVMGAHIAAHFANAELRVRLLDASPDAAFSGLERAKRLEPDPFFTSRRRRSSRPEASPRTGADCSTGRSSSKSQKKPGA